MTSVPVLAWSPVVGRQNNAQVLCDSTIDQTWNIALYGTAPNNERVHAQTVIVDNMGNNATVYFTYGIARYQVAPYTRKTIYLLKDQLYVIFSVTTGVLTLTFCDFDPDLPEEVNQVATNISGSGGGSGTGGGSGSYDTFSTTDHNGLAVISGANLTLTAVEALWAAGRNNIAAIAASKFYWEVTVNSGIFTDCGIGSTSASIANNAYVGADAQGFGYHYGGQYTTGGAFVGAGTSYGAGSIIKFALNVAAARWWYAKVGQDWMGVPANDPVTPATGINVAALANFYIMCSSNSGAVNLNTGSSPFADVIPTGYTGWTT